MPFFPASQNPAPPPLYAGPNSNHLTPMPTGGGGGVEIVPRFRKSPLPGDPALIGYDPYYGATQGAYLPFAGEGFEEAMGAYDLPPPQPTRQPSPEMNLIFEQMQQGLEARQAPPIGLRGLFGGGS